MPDQTKSNTSATSPQGADANRTQTPAGERKEPWRGETQGEQAKTISFVAEPSQEARLAAVKAAVNPLLEAAQPLLRALCDMPKDLEPVQVDVLRRLLLREVSNFRAICTSAQIRHERMVAASYALCTAIDEAVQRKRWGGGEGGETGVWAAKSLAHEFHEDTKGGHKVFLLIGRLAASPQEHVDLIDLLFFILALGFEGEYRSKPQGRRQLEMIRHRLHDMVLRVRGEVPRELSPHWRGEGAAKLRFLRTVPVWVTASLLSLALLGQYAWYKYQLVQKSAGVEADIRAIGALRPPPAPVRKSLRLKELLAPEIARGTVSVEEDDEHSAVSFKGDDMFVAGRAQVNAKLLPTIAKVASEINEVSGTVRVTGHSDNRPIRTRQFPDNQALSEKRAAAVAEVLKSSGVAPERLVVEGKGDAQPVADNATPPGRARNRRVDIVVTQGDAPPAPANRPTATHID
ncbi:type VI secretion system protein TssL, long form [Variovorax ureilyticus]|uniref:Type VI secretion system protein TssL, long form n=1 Tax=Variovorax ureilyticus TaxID=1836198 RepID=A0ABU8VB37_9BURK